MNCFTSIAKKFQPAQVKKAVQVLGATLGLLLFCLPGFSQLNYGRIFGGITDQSGGAIVGATVTVRDVARGVSRPLISDGAGEYSAPSLTPGMYTVRAEAKGFQTVERTDITVGVGQDIRVDLTLQPGAQTQTITVTGELPMVNTANAQLGATLENQTIGDLPLNGREYDKLLDYTPGMVSKPGGGSPGFAENGTRSDATVWLFDGLDDMNAWSAAGPTIGGPQQYDEVTILPLDAIQEVNVIENPEAEYGGKAGAVINVGLKSGTNSLHGTAYGFGRDAAMDAKNAFLGPTLPKATDSFGQYGAGLGGPIKKDKIFYFGNYEGQRFTVGTPRTVQIPTATSGAGVSGSFPDAIAAMNAAHEPLSQLSLNLAGCTSAGICNAANGLFGNSTKSATEPFNLNSVGGSDNGIEKIDYHINDHDALNGEYFLGDGNFDFRNSGIQYYWAGAQHVRAQTARGVWVWTPSSTWVNEARLGYDKYNQRSGPAECTQQLGQPNYETAFGFISGAPQVPPECGFPLVTISGLTGLGASPSDLNLFSTYHATDSVSYTRGKHLFKFGGEAHVTRYHGSAINSNATGTLTFGAVAAFAGATALEDFLSGVPATGALRLGNATRNLIDPRFAGFAQDDWRLTPRLTLNLGLRYEKMPGITESNDLLGNFDPNTPSGLVQQTDGHPLYNQGNLNFAPRLGMAWDVTGKGTTVVRAGGGITYTFISMQSLIQAPQGASLGLTPTGFPLHAANGSIVPPAGNIETGTISLGTAELPWLVGTPVFNSSPSALTCGNGLPATAPGTGTNPPPCSIASIDPNVPEAYYTNWTVGVQHAFTNSISMNIGYVGNHGSRLTGLLDVNQPTSGAANTAAAEETEQIRRPFYSQFPYLSKIVVSTNDFYSNYNALQAGLNARASHGLTFRADYAFARALDESSGNVSQTVMDSLDPQRDYARGTNVPSSTFRLTATYNIPGLKSPGQVLEGWQVNTAFVVDAGIPFNAADSTSDISGTGELLDRWTLVGPASTFKVGGPGTVPCFGIVGSSFGKTANCVEALPAACVLAAAAEPEGPGGTTGTASLDSFGCYMEGNSVIVPPAQGTYGSMGRDVLEDLPFSEWDFSATKIWKFKERYSAQFRAEFFNLLNRTHYASPSSNPNAPSTFGESQATPSSGNPVLGDGGPRTVQLGLKLIF